MIRDIVNVLSISWARNTASKLVGNILNVLVMYQLGFSQVHCPCPCNVFTMSWVRKLGFAPSVYHVDCVLEVDLQVISCLAFTRCIVHIDCVNLGRQFVRISHLGEV